METSRCARRCQRHVDTDNAVEDDSDDHNDNNATTKTNDHDRDENPDLKSLTWISCCESEFAPANYINRQRVRSFFQDYRAQPGTTSKLRN
jgi:hypothetical protein